MSVHSHGKLSLVCMRSAHYKRTNTSCLGAVESESGVARQTIRSAVHRTANAGLCDAVVAGAHFYYEGTRRKWHDANANFQANTHACPDTNTYGYTRFQRGSV